MSDDFSTEALAYLLEEMSAERRAAFEERLARDPALRAELKACADSLAEFAVETAPAEPMPLADQREALSVILAASQPTVASAPGRPRRTAWPHYVWPIAAALLLGLNLVEFNRPFDPVPAPSQLPQSNPSTHSAPTSTDHATASTDNPRAPSAHLQTDDTVVPLPDNDTGDAVTSVPVVNSRQLAQLRRENAELQRRNSNLRADYDAALRHLADRAILERGTGRLAAMELVDAGSYARGERRGLLEVARGILTAPGVVVDGDLSPATPDPLAGSAVPNPAVNPSRSSPYAWAVFDEQEHRGYVNLYNLPAPPADQSLQLWVKPAEATTYQLVGEVPAQMPEGTGSYYYTLPPNSPAPAEILITQEPRNATPVAPAGSVVLRGP